MYPMTSLTLNSLKMGCCWLCCAASICDAILSLGCFELDVLFDVFMFACPFCSYLFITVCDFVFCVLLVRLIIV